MSQDSRDICGCGAPTTEKHRHRICASGDIGFAAPSVGSVNCYPCCVGLERAPPHGVAPTPCRALDPRGNPRPCEGGPATIRGQTRDSAGMRSRPEEKPSHASAGLARRPDWSYICGRTELRVIGAGCRAMPIRGYFLFVTPCLLAFLWFVGWYSQPAPPVKAQPAVTAQAAAQPAKATPAPPPVPFVSASAAKASAATT